MKSLRDTIRAADELDARRRHQIANQVQSINRLMEGGTYDSERAHLHEELARVQTELDKATGRL